MLCFFRGQAAGRLGSRLGRGSRRLEDAGGSWGGWRTLEDVGGSWEESLFERSTLSSQNIDFSHGGVNPPGFEDKTFTTLFKMLVISASLPNEFQYS